MPDLTVQVDRLSGDELRTLVLEGIKSLTASSAQDGPPYLQSLFRAVARAEVQRRVRVGADTSPGVTSSRRNPELTMASQCRVRDVVWELILEGIVVPGQRDQPSDTQLASFHLTPRGELLVKEDKPTPYDPDGYLGHLRTTVPSLDPMILTYMEECLRTYRMGCPLASAVTLGCASEKAFLLLVDALKGWLQGAARTKFENSTQGKSIARVYNEFQDRFRSHVQTKLPAKLGDHSEVTLNGIFTLIRTLRNDAGHPTGEAMPDRVLYATIQMFDAYVKTVYDLIDWLQKHPQGLAP